MFALNIQFQPLPFQGSARCFLSAWQVRTSKTTSFENDHYIIYDTLSIPAVTMEDSGEYTCMANNSAGSRNASVMLRVVGERFPKRPGRCGLNHTESGVFSSSASTLL